MRGLAVIAPAPSADAAVAARSRVQASLTGGAGPACARADGAWVAAWGVSPAPQPARRTSGTAERSIRRTRTERRVEAMLRVSAPGLRRSFGPHTQRPRPAAVATSPYS